MPDTTSHDEPDEPDATTDRVTDRATDAAVGKQVSTDVPTRTSAPPHLPSRPLPERVEALHSYVTRLAEANHLTIRDLLGYQPTPTSWRTGPPELLDAVAAVTGHPGEFLRAMTFADYDVTHGGALQGFAGLRPLNQLVVCHHCYSRDGIRLRDWDHALCVICRDCNRLLEPLKTPAPRMRRPLGETQIKLRHVLVELDWSKDPENHYARENFRLMRRLAGPILRGISPTWPRHPDKLVKQWHAEAAHDLDRHPGKREPSRPASTYVATIALLHAWDKAIIGRDHDLVQRLERRFPATPKPRPMRRFR